MEMQSYMFHSFIAWLIAVAIVLATLPVAGAIMSRLMDYWDS